MVANKGTVFQRSLNTANELFIVRPYPKTGRTAKVYNVSLGPYTAFYRRPHRVSRHTYTLPLRKVCPFH